MSDRSRPQLVSVSQDFMQAPSTIDTAINSTIPCQVLNNGKQCDPDDWFTDATLDLSVKQLADLCGCTEDAVKARRYRGQHWPFYQVFNAISKRPDLAVKLHALVTGIDLSEPELEALFVTIRNLFAARRIAAQADAVLKPAGLPGRNSTACSGGAGEPVAHGDPASIRRDRS